MRPKVRSNENSIAPSSCIPSRRAEALLDSLMAEVMEGHIKLHLVDPDDHPTSAQAKAAQDLIDVIKTYLT